MSKRISQAEYDAFFNDSLRAKDNVSYTTEKEKEQKSTKAEALKYALEIRSFEIELYWKRATYFWAFIGATLAGYGAVQASSIAPKQDLAVALSCLGLVFSFGWFCVNKGSKQWQENWENHVDLLEDDIIGPLYKIVLGRPKSTGIITKIERFIAGPGPYSVTKINQMISLFVTVLWGYLLWITLHSPRWPFKDGKYTLIIAMAVIACCLFLKLGKTDLNEEDGREIAKKDDKVRQLVAVKRSSRIDPS
jgi:hypothetical protein